MTLAEIHIINPNNSLYKECDRLCFLSKNLYNATLYEIKKQYSIDKKYLNYHELNKLFVDSNNPDYRALHANVSQQTMMQLDKNHKYYFKALKEYIKHPSKFKAIPKPPKFKDKINGRNIIIYNKHYFNAKPLRDGIISLQKSSIRLRTKIDTSAIQQVRIIPMDNLDYKIEVIYNKQELPKVLDNGIYCGIDLGLNNLFAVAFNNNQTPLLVNGKPLKSINQYYNTKKASIQSRLEKCNKKRTSKHLKRLTKKRNNKIQMYLHKSTKILVSQLKQANVSKVVIGKNNNWKDSINIGNKNNQNFVSLPHARAIELLTYKLQLQGIEVITREESYTSICSAIDQESIKKHDVYLGKRTSRGLFRTSNGIVINADINGAANILRKEMPNAYANGIEGLVVSPMMLAITH